MKICLAAFYMWSSLVIFSTTCFVIFVLLLFMWELPFAIYNLKIVVWSISPQLSQFSVFQPTFFEMSVLLLSNSKFHQLSSSVIGKHDLMLDCCLIEHFDIFPVINVLTMSNINKFVMCQQSDIKSCFPMTFEDNWWNVHFERSNISKNVCWKALNCESRGEIDLSSCFCHVFGITMLLIWHIVMVMWKHAWISNGIDCINVMNWSWNTN